MEAKKLDSILLIAMVLIAFVSAFFFFSPISFELGESRTSIGTMISGQNVVKLRSASSPFWQDATFHDQLSHRDLIYTHADASASIELSSGDKITLGEKTLFRIDENQLGRTELNLQRGTIKAQLSDRGIDLKLGNFQGKLTGPGQEILLSKDGADQLITPLGGSVELKLADNRSISLGANDQLLVNTKEPPKVQKGIAVLKSFPELNQQLEAIYPLELHFTFEVSKEDQDQHNFKIQLARSPSFKKTLAVKHLTAEIAEAGTYYWRVGTGKRWSNPRPFHVSLLRPIELLSPFPSQKVGILDATENLHPQAIRQLAVQFSWKKQDVASYQLQLTTPSGGEQMYQAKDHQLLVPLDKIGEYQWRVKATLGAHEVISPVRKFRIELRKMAEAPRLITPQDKASLSLFRSEGVGVHLKWDYEEEKSKYLVELFDSTGNLLTSTSSSENNIFLPLKAFGEYSWQVRTTDLWGRELISPKSSFSIKYLKLKSNFPQQGVELQLLKPNQNVKFEWLSDSAGTRYLFELAKTAQFVEPIISREVQGNRVEISFPELGVYYWRTKMILPDGSFSFSEPIKMQVAPSPPPVAPDLRPESVFEIDLKSSFIPMPTSIRYFICAFDWFISKAFGEELQTEANLSWKSYPNAAFYQVEIYRDEDARDLLLREKVSEAKLKFSNPGAGTYYWRVAIIDHWGRQGPFSELSRLQLVLSNRLSELNPTELALPAKNKEIPASQKFSWKADKRVVSSILQIAFDEHFKQILLKRRSSKSEIVIDFKSKEILPKIQSADTLYWRVLSQDQLKRTTISGHRSFSLYRPKKVTPIERPRQKQIDDVFTYSFHAMTGARYFDSTQQSDSIGYQFDGMTMQNIRFSGVHQFSKWKGFATFDYARGEVFGQAIEQYELDLAARFPGHPIFPKIWREVGVDIYSISLFGLPKQIDGDPVVDSSTLYFLPFIGLGRDWQYKNFSFDFSGRLGLFFNGFSYGMNVRGSYQINKRWQLALDYRYRQLHLDGGDLQQSSQLLLIGPGYSF